MAADNIDIVEYNSKYRLNYKYLNYEWLTKYFEVEPNDEKMLSNPEEEVLNKGGHIFFALINHEVVGTCTLVKIDDSNYELTKMCVTKKAQRKGVGKKLLDVAIAKARKLDVDKVYVSTGKALSAALHLYHENGFQEIDTQVSPTKKYKRTEISMVRDINSRI
jgi:N-acetylglutamate synthase-like GNAT family acetyltransferase